MVVKKMNTYDQIVKTLMLPVTEGGSGLNEKDALAAAERVLKTLQPK